MAYIQTIDVSQWQGNIDWNQVPCPIAIIKMSGGDDGLYLDTKANQNYYGAQRAGKAIGMYHFAGGTDAIAEADYFVNACSPLAENDVLILDWEMKHSDPVGWCTEFVNRVHDRTDVWPLLYINGSTSMAYDWSPVISCCGLYVAWYDRDPDDLLPIPHVYVMHQYTSNGNIPGVDGRVDLDAWFGTLEQFKAYGYHSVHIPEPPVVVTEPTPVEVPPVEPTPPAPDPVVEPLPPVVIPTIPDTPTPSAPVVVIMPRSFWQYLIDFIKKLLILSKQKG